MRVIDVSDRARPRKISRYINRMMGNKPQAYNNIVLHGKRAIIAVDYCGLEIVDIAKIGAIRQIVNVSNPARPVLSGRFGAPKNRAGTWGLSMRNNLILLSYIRTPIPFRSNWAGIKAIRR